MSDALDMSALDTLDMSALDKIVNKLNKHNENTGIGNGNGGNNNGNNNNNNNNGGISDDDDDDNGDKDKDNYLQRLIDSENDDNYYTNLINKNLQSSIDDSLPFSKITPDPVVAIATQNKDIMHSVIDALVDDEHVSNFIKEQQTKMYSNTNNITSTTNNNNNTTNTNNPNNTNTNNYTKPHSAGVLLAPHVHENHEELNQMHYNPHSP